MKRTLVALMLVFSLSVLFGCSQSFDFNTVNSSDSAAPTDSASMSAEKENSSFEPETTAPIEETDTELNESAKETTTETTGTEPSEEIVGEFKLHEFLEEHHFTHGISQGDFISQISAYCYAEEKLENMLEIMHYDGLFGGGCIGENELFGFSNDYTQSEDGSYADYSNGFYTRTELDDFSLPGQLNFGDTLSVVLKKLTFDLDPMTDFVSDENNEGTMTLFSDATSSLKLTDCTNSSDLSKIYQYQLQYKEFYDHVYEGGKESAVTRTITMSFSLEDAKLESFNVKVNERYRVGFFVRLAENYDLAEPLNELYYPGEEITVKLATFTEGYYVLYVNGVEQQITSSDLEYTYFSFVMPREDVVIEIEERSVDIPEYSDDYD